MTVDFGVARRIEQVKLYFLDDGERAAVQAPARYAIQTWNGRTWIDARIRQRSPQRPEGHRANVVDIVPGSFERMRVVLTPRRGAAVGMTELENWGSI